MFYVMNQMNNLH